CEGTECQQWEGDQEPRRNSDRGERGDTGEEPSGRQAHGTTLAVPTIRRTFSWPTVRSHRVNPHRQDGPARSYRTAHLEWGHVRFPSNSCNTTGPGRGMACLGRQIGRHTSELQ